METITMHKAQIQREQLAGESLRDVVRREWGRVPVVKPERESVRPVDAVRIGGAR